MKYCWRWISSGVGWLVHPRRSAGLPPRTLPVVFYWPVKAEPSKKRKEGKTEKANGLAENPANLVER